MDVSLKVPQRDLSICPLWVGRTGTCSRLAFFAIFLAMVGTVKAEMMPPKPDRYFNDYAGVVDQATASEMNEQLAQFERDTSTQIVVAIYRTMSAIGPASKACGKAGCKG